MTISKGIQRILSDTERVPTFSDLSPHVNFHTHAEFDSGRAASFPQSAAIFVEKYTAGKIKAACENLACPLRRAGRFYPLKKKMLQGCTLRAINALYAYNI